MAGEHEREMAGQGVHAGLLYIPGVGWEKVTTPQFARACDGSSRQVLTCTDLAFQTFLDRSVCLTSAVLETVLLRPIRTSSKVRNLTNSFAFSCFVFFFFSLLCCCV